mmetsp:Transcript_17619/g.39025  ORF Transcript_17619/g.39025 Transcript_17619/m.39025 type:complete len:291 (-) Transcript_17619:287-1159(-)
MSVTTPPYHLSFRIALPSFPFLLDLVTNRTFTRSPRSTLLRCSSIGIWRTYAMIAGSGGTQICCFDPEDFLLPPPPPPPPLFFFCDDDTEPPRMFLRFRTPPFFDGDLPRCPPLPRFCSFLFRRSPSSSELDCSVSNTPPMSTLAASAEEEDEDDESSSDESSDDESSSSPELLSESPLLVLESSLPLDDPDDDEDDRDDSSSSSSSSSEEESESLSSLSGRELFRPPRFFCFRACCKRRCCSLRFLASSFFRLRSLSFCSSFTSVPVSARDCFNAKRRELIVADVYLSI